MAATLPGLPAELLLRIAESCAYRRDQFENLRGTSKKINEKIVRFYGQAYYKEHYMLLTKEGLARLVTISCGQLAFHVQSVTISCSTLLDHREISESSESSSASDNPWYEDIRNSWDGYISRVTFNEVIFEMLMNGHAADLLGSTLAKFPNLKRIEVIPPYARWEIKGAMLGKLQWRWTLAAKAILSVTLARAAPQHTLIFRHRKTSMAVDASILEHMSIYANKLRALTSFGINVTATTDCKCFGHGADNSGLFKQLSKLEPKLKLRRLQIRQLRTRKKYLKMFLRPTRSTIEALVLDHVSVEADTNVVDFLRAEMKLKEVTLRYLNSGEHGLHFDQISLQRPSCYFGHRSDNLDWVNVIKSSSPRHEIKLKEEEGDDITYWLLQIEDLSLYGDAWAKDDKYLS
ncbi:hypothetical protein FB567DRAFT_577966 [Paraphoma chrysanthemicola]|uniref:Uncharacterized protein n=1 Tax=Paraphoma chrysanthemicola TaxID=798071 RepID=A0A8K0W0V2_9PLEO|nr:hypothetical protein FB567DRAFT_577966 [Paraphoma chrysanthemicola]